MYYVRCSDGLQILFHLFVDLTARSITISKIFSQIVMRLSTGHSYLNGIESILLFLSLHFAVGFKQVIFLDF